MRRPALSLPSCQSFPFALPWLAISPSKRRRHCQKHLISLPALAGRTAFPRALIPAEGSVWDRVSRRDDQAVQDHVWDAPQVWRRRLAAATLFRARVLQLAEVARAAVPLSAGVRPVREAEPSRPASIDRLA